MELGVNVPLIEKGKRPPNTTDARIAKKVKLQNGGETEQATETEECINESIGDHGITETPRSPFSESIPPENTDTVTPPNATDTGVTQSQLKVSNDEPASHEAMPTVNQPKPSFKENFVGTTNKANTETETANDELKLEEEDVMVSIDDQVPEMNFSKRIKDIMLEYMQRAVVVKILGPYIRQTTLHNKIIQMWKPKGRFKLTELEGGCFMVRFDDEIDFQNALLGGPWVVLGHYLTVHPWEPSFSPQNLEIK